MSTTIYKKLFEVRILHDYFLGEGNLQLLPALDAGRYRVGSFLEIAPTPAATELMKGQRMRMVATPLGFFVGLEVRQEDAGTDRFYRPFIALGDEVPLTFYIRPTNGLFGNYTNLPLDTHVPAICYFSNTKARKASNNDLLLSQPPPAIEVGNNSYVMGELLASGAAVKEIIVKRDNSQELREVDSEGVVNRSDKGLLPKKFVFDFRRDAAGAAEFKLSKDGIPVKNISKTQADQARYASLDFEKQADNQSDIPDGEYDLEVSSPGFSFKKKVLLNDKLYNKRWLGVLDIRPKSGTASPDLDLLDSQGRLKARIENGIKKPHPVFELRFLSRKTFWRYSAKQEIGDADFPDTFLERHPSERNILFTREPRAFSDTLTGFGGSYLPNASPASLLLLGRTYYSDIVVSAVNTILKK